jgi:hypothetical protein
VIIEEIVFKGKAEYITSSDKISSLETRSGSEMPFLVLIK